MKKSFNLLLVLFLGILMPVHHTCHAQNARVDSLLKILNDKSDNESRVDLLNTLGHEVLDTDLSKSRAYVREAIELAAQLNYRKGLGRAYDLLAITYQYENDPDKALDNFLKSAQYYDEADDEENLAIIYNEIGLVLKNKGNYQRALDYFNKTFSIHDKLNNKAGTSTALLNIGLVYRYQANYEKAIENYIKSLKIKEEIDDKWGIALLLANLGTLYKDQKDYEQALEYNLKVKGLFEEMDDKRSLGIVLNNIGLIYEEMKQDEKALGHYQHALNIFETLGLKSAMGTSLLNIGSIYLNQENYEASLESNRKALEIFKELEQKSLASSAYIDIGSTYTKLGKFNNALENLYKGLDMAKDTGNKEKVLKGYKALFEFYEATGDYTQSLSYYKQFSALKDSIFNIKKSEQIAEIQTRYETEKKEQENELLRRERAIKDKTISEQEYENKLLLFGVLFFLIFTGYFYYVYHQKKQTNKLLSLQNDEINQKQQEIIQINDSLKQSQQQLSRANAELLRLNTGLENTIQERTSELQQINIELDTFLYQSSHALRRPIVSIQGLVNIARMESNGQANGATLIYDKIVNTANKMDLMLKKLVMASEINFSGNGRQEIDFENIITEAWGELGQRFACEKISFNFSISNHTHFIAERVLVKIIFQNLLENALLHHVDPKERNAFIRVSVKRFEATVIINVEDNGSGISKEAIHKIFDMFTVANHTPKGFGLGLYIVKKAVEKLNGTISVDSKENEYSKFKIVLPG